MLRREGGKIVRHEALRTSWDREVGTQKNFVYSVVNGTADQTPAKEEVSTICPVIVKWFPQGWCDYERFVAPSITYFLGWHHLISRCVRGENLVDALMAPFESPALSTPIVTLPCHLSDTIFACGSKRCFTASRLASHFLLDTLIKRGTNVKVYLDLCLELVGGEVPSFHTVT